MKFVSNKLRHLQLASELLCKGLDLPPVKIKLVKKQILTKTAGQLATRQDGLKYWKEGNPVLASGTYTSPGVIELWTGTDCEATLLHELSHHLQSVKKYGTGHGASFRHCLGRIVTAWKVQGLRQLWEKQCK